MDVKQSLEDAKKHELVVAINRTWRFIHVLEDELERFHATIPETIEKLIEARKVIVEPLKKKVFEDPKTRKAYYVTKRELGEYGAGLVIVQDKEVIEYHLSSWERHLFSELAEMYPYTLLKILRDESDRVDPRSHLIVTIDDKEAKDHLIQKIIMHVASRDVPDPYNPEYRDDLYVVASPTMQGVRPVIKRQWYFDDGTRPEYQAFEATKEDLEWLTPRQRKVLYRELAQLKINEWRSYFNTHAMCTHSPACFTHTIRFYVKDTQMWHSYFDWYQNVAYSPDDPNEEYMVLEIFCDRDTGKYLATHPQEVDALWNELLENVKKKRLAFFFEDVIMNEEEVER